MKELKSADVDFFKVLDQEIFEDAQKKANRILRFLGE